MEKHQKMHEVRRNTRLWYVITTYGKELNFKNNDYNASKLFTIVLVSKQLREQRKDCLAWSNGQIPVFAL